jgi:hypothetical protein
MSDSRLLIFTAGVSLLRNLNDEEEGHGRGIRSTMERTLNRLKPEELLKKPEKTWAGAPGNHLNPGAYWFLDHYGRLDPDKNAQRQTAELTSLYHMRPQAGDKIVLLSSHTKKGLFCALANAHLMLRPGGEIKFRDNLTDERPPEPVVVNWEWQPQREVPCRALSEIACAEVEVIRIPGLNPTDRHNFEKQGAGNLIRTLATLVYECIRDGGTAKSLDGGRRPQIVFTGGFKASIPLLTQAAIWMSHAVPIPMYALYEEAKEILAIPTLHALPDRKFCRLALGFQSADNPLLDERYAEFTNRASMLRVADLPSEEQLLFADKPGSNGIMLNPLGQTLREVEHAKLKADSKTDSKTASFSTEEWDRIR